MEPIEALEAIATDIMPCVMCGRAHECRSITRRFKGKDCEGVSWADPDDGHFYRPMSPKALALRVLSGRREP